MKYELEFLNPVGVVSANFSTVRLGKDWAERTQDERDRSIHLVDSKGKSLGGAEVMDCWTGPLSALPALLIEVCHDPVCRTWSGVAQILAGLYDSDEMIIGFDTVVTVLRLKHTGSIIKLVS